MALDKITYAAAKKYTDNSMRGGGAVRGKNCVISSIAPITGGNRVTFQWTLDNGTVQTGTMDVMDGADGQDGATGAQGPQGPAGADGQDGADGLGIKSVTVNAEDHLIITYDDDTTQDAGQIEITAAVDSVNGKTGEVELTASDVGALPDDTTIPSKLSELTNDDNYVQDASYVHTDNNYDATAKSAVDGMSTALDGKVDKVNGKGLSTNDYDTTAKTAVDALKSASTKDTTTFVSPGNHDIPDADAIYKAMTSMLEGAFHPAGNKTVAELTSALLIQANVGNVYKITDNGTTDANWVGGAGQTITAGQMAVVVYGNAAGTFLFNLENGINIDLSAYQTKLLSAPITVDGTEKTNVEDTLAAINTLAAANKTDIGSIKDGTTIDSFGDVETALSDKVDKVSGATNGNFAGLDANGNLTDSGKKAADFATPTDISNLESRSKSILKDTVGWTGKNLLKLSASSQTKSGVTFTVNGDGSITLNGTYDSDTYTNLTITTQNKSYSDMLYGKTLVASLGAATLDNLVLLQVYNFDGANGQRVAYAGGNDSTEFTWSNNNGTGFAFNIQLPATANGHTFNNYRIYPMLRYADVEDRTFEAYHDSVETMYEEEIHGINLLRMNSGTKTVNGITFTNNKNGSWKINGTATANTYPVLGEVIGGKLKYPTIISQGNVVTNGCRIYLNAYKNGSYTFNIMTSLPGTTETFIDIPTNNDYDSIMFGFNIPEGSVIDNLTLTPMLRKADVDDSIYRPFNHESIQNQLNKHTTVLGSKNLLINKAAATATVYGLTVTRNDDGTVTVDGTATGNAAIGINGNLLNELDPKETYIFSGAPITASEETYFTYVGYNPGNGSFGHEYGNGVEFSLSSLDITYTTVTYYIFVRTGSVLNNVVFKPMIRLASDPDDTYEPYAKTNRQLTYEGPVLKSYPVEWNEDLNVGTDKGGSIIQYGKLYFVTYWFKATTALTGNVGIIKLPKNGLTGGNYVITEGNDTAIWGGKATKDGVDYVSISCPMIVDKVYRAQCVWMDFT